jgi:hypothetical protein
MTEPSPAATEDPPAGQSPGTSMASHDAPATAAPALETESPVAPAEATASHDAPPAPATEPAAGAGQPDADPAQPPTPPPAAPGTPAAGPPRRQRGAQALALLRRHWLFSALLAAGLVLRVLAQIAYHPALIYVDTLKYLYGASPGSEPPGYTGILRVILLAGDLGTVTAIQHLLGLGMAAALYTVLLRRGLPRWLAALAVAPVLLDAYQLQMEQMIMPDVWFEALIVAGIVVLLWRAAATLPYAIAGGLLLGLASTVMQLGEVLIVPAVIYLLASATGWRQAFTRAAALACAFVLVVLGCSGYNYAENGHFWLARKQTLNGRLAAAADCATLRLPAAARPTCPTLAEQANGPDWLEHNGNSPLFHARPGTIGELDSAVFSQQPLRVLGSILRDSVRLFALTRDGVPSVTPISRWQFQTGYPTYPPWVSVCPAGQLAARACLIQQQTIQKQVAPVSDLLVRPGGAIVVGVQLQEGGVFAARTLKPSYGGDAQVDRPIAAFLRGYQIHGGYTPGPLFLLFTLTGLAGSLLLLSRRLDRRTQQLGLTCLLFTSTAIVVLAAPDIYEFSWRYELPAVVTLVPAGLLGIWTLRSLRKARKEPQDAPAVPQS